MLNVRSSELANAAELRVRGLPQRLAIVGFVAALMHMAHDWPLVWLWAGAYLASSLLERAAGRAFLKRCEVEPEASGWGFAAAFSLVTLVYGALSVPLLLLAHARGGEVHGVIMLAGGLLNVLIVSRASRVAFLASVGPYACYLLLNPVLAYAAGVDALSWVNVAGALLMLAHTHTAWSLQRTSLQAQAEAAAESEHRRQEAEFATAAKSAFVATVSHELRTPLSGIIAVAAQLQARPHNAAEHEAVEVLVDSGQFMKTLLDDLLDLAKLEAGRMSSETLAFDPGELLWKLERHWSATARETGRPLQLTAALNLPHCVQGDPTRLRQILNNLLSNALKFTGPEGVTWCVEGQEDGDLWWLEIRVSDTGPGIASEKLARLFTPYDQTDDSIARTHGGTGLGLALSRELARLMGGELTVVSEQGRGSTFVLNIPMQRSDARAEALPFEASLAAPAATTPTPASAPLSASEPAPAPELPAAPVGRGLRVLVVDDHPINRRTASLLLEANGMDVSTVEGAEEALALLQVEPFDVVLTDLHMPGMDGLALARAIPKRTGLNRSVPVIALSGADSAEDQAACRAAGMRGCVSKPIDPKALYRAIEDACADRLPAAERSLTG